MLWDIFCRVIDNYGDIGVSWRLSADMAARGEQVRLWVDDASALQWMAPGALENAWPGVQVLSWNQSCRADLLTTLAPADVWIEAFGCEIPQAFVAHFAQQVSASKAAKPPVWLNLEYLSAEDYVERCHGLPSPVMHGPAQGWTKTFFYPGFTPRTGGLLREASVAQYPRSTGKSDAPPALTISLFCYEPAHLGSLLEQLAASVTPVRLLVTHGRAAAAVRLLAQDTSSQGALQIEYLPAMSQQEYDQLLQACDINFVRGEDSVVRALWAGKPFVWHIYPQDDQAHLAKLDAFLAQMRFNDDVCTLNRAWNGLGPWPEQCTDLLALRASALALWRTEVQAARARQIALRDLSSQLTEFVLKNR